MEKSTVVAVIYILCHIGNIVKSSVQIKPLNDADCTAKLTPKLDGSITISTQESSVDSNPSLPVNQECAFEVASSQENPTLLQVQTGTIDGIDYLYADRLTDACGTRYLSLKGPQLQSCTISLTDTWQLHFRGQMSLELRELDKTDDGIENGRCNDYTSTCPTLQEYSRVVRCKRDAHPGYQNHLRCNLTNEDLPDCMHQLKDRAVQSKCPVQNRLVTRDRLLVFPNMTRIAFLDISGQNLMGLDTGTFKIIGPYVPVYLNLTGNAIHEIHAGTFHGLGNLLALFLDFNFLQVLKKNCFQGAENIVRLKLISNQIAEIDSGAFFNLTRIEYINLENNTLKTLPEDVFAGLYMLKHLNLNDNSLMHLPWDIFKDLSNLNFLNLRNNKLESLPALGPLINLQTLYLQGNGLHQVVKKAFQGLPETIPTFLVDQPEICQCYATKYKSCAPEIDSVDTPYLPCGRLLAEVVLVCFTWIIGLASLLGNIFVICWRRLAKEQENQIQSLLLRNLALSDLLMGIYMLIITTVDVHYGEYFPMWSQQWRRSSLCKLAGTLAITSSEASVFFITLISIDRFLCIRYPSPASRYHTTKIWLVVAATWVIAFTLGVVPSVLAGHNPDFYDNSHVCIGLPLARNQIYGKSKVAKVVSNFDSTLDESNASITALVPEDTMPTMYFSTAIFLGLNLLCFLIVFLCYMEIIRTVRQSLKRNQRDMKRQVQLTLRVSAIVATDFCTWCPIIIIGILVQLDVTEISPRVFAWMVTIVLPINSAINPYLYTLATVIANHLKAKLGKESLENVEVQALTRLQPDQGTKTAVSLISHNQRNGMQEDSQI